MLHHNINQINNKEPIYLYLNNNNNNSKFWREIRMLEMVLDLDSIQFGEILNNNNNNSNNNSNNYNNHKMKSLIDINNSNSRCNNNNRW